MGCHGFGLHFGRESLQFCKVGSRKRGATARLSLSFYHILVHLAQLAGGLRSQRSVVVNQLNVGIQAVAAGELLYLSQQ